MSTQSRRLALATTEKSAPRAAVTGNVFSGFRVFGVVVVLLSTDPSFAVDEVSVSVGIFTRHISPGDDTNEQNRLVALGIDHWVAARYKNSYSRTTYFAGRRWSSDKLNLAGGDGGPFIQGNLYGGLVHGYGDRFPNLAGVTPALAPGVAIGYRRGSLEVLYVPTDTGGVFTGFFTYRFGD